MQVLSVHPVRHVLRGNKPLDFPKSYYYTESVETYSTRCHRPAVAMVMDEGWKAILGKLAAVVVWGKEEYLMPDTVCEVMASALRGKSTHVESVCAVSDLPATSAALRPAPGVHSPQEILSHMVYWQNLILQAVRGERVLWLERAAEGKQDYPIDDGPSDWETLLARFHAGLLEAEHLALTVDLERPLINWEQGTVLSALSTLAMHNSYHLGQMVMARQLVEHWPTPGGGDAG